MRTGTAGNELRSSSSELLDNRVVNIHSENEIYNIIEIFHKKATVINLLLLIIIYEV